MDPALRIFVKAGGVVSLTRIDDFTSLIIESHDQRLEHTSHLSTMKNHSKNNSLLMPHYSIKGQTSHTPVDGCDTSRHDVTSTHLKEE